MATIHERLRGAAKAGSEAKLKALLRDTSVDALAKDDHGLTASGWAADRGYKSLARLIDAYALAQSEHVAIQAQVSSGLRADGRLHGCEARPIIKQD